TTMHEEVASNTQVVKKFSFAHGRLLALSTTGSIPESAGLHEPDRLTPGGSFTSNMNLFGKLEGRDTAHRPNTAWPPAAGPRFQFISVKFASPNVLPQYRSHAVLDPTG